MSKMVWIAPNLAYQAAFSGGGWLDGDMSLAALHDRVLGHKARSANAAPASTQMTIALDRVQPVGGIAILGHNVSTRGRVIIQGARDAAFTQIECNAAGEAVPFYPRLFRTRDLPWSHPNWFSGKPTAREIGRTTTQLIYLLPRNRSLRYWRIRIEDTQNPDGYVELGKVIIGPRFDFPFNFAVGGSFSILDESKVVQSLGGTRYFDKRSKRRRMAFNFAYLDGPEQFSRLFDILADLGTTEEFMLIENPDDARNIQRTSFCAHLVQPTPLEYQTWRHIGASHVAEELI